MYVFPYGDYFKMNIFGCYVGGGGWGLGFQALGLLAYCRLANDFKYVVELAMVERSIILSITITNG